MGAFYLSANVADTLRENFVEKKKTHKKDLPPHSLDRHPKQDSNIINSQKLI